MTLGSNDVLCKGRFVRGTLCPWDLISVGPYVRGTLCPWDDLSRGTICPVGRFVRGTLCMGTLWSLDVLSYDVFSVHHFDN